MENLQDHINRISQKLQEKMKGVAALQKENLQQKEQISTLTAQQNALQQKLKVLQEQNYILKAATSKMEPHEKQALEQSINKYIREIDKCIALLSE